MCVCVYVCMYIYIYIYIYIYYMWMELYTCTSFSNLKQWCEERTLKVGSGSAAHGTIQNALTNK